MLSLPAQRASDVPHRGLRVGRERSPATFRIAGSAGRESVPHSGLVTFHTAGYRGTSPVKYRNPPQDQHMTLGIVLPQGPRKGVFLMSEVPL